MGHEVCYDSFSYKTSKAHILAECNDYAIREGDYHTALDGIRFIDRVIYKSYDEAEEAIDKLDNGWYDCLAVPYYMYPQFKVSQSEAYKKSYFRYVDAKKRYEELATRIHYTPSTVSSKTVSCRYCKTRYQVACIRSNSCGACGKDLRPDSTLKAIKSAYDKYKELEVNTQLLFDKCYAKSMKQQNIKPELMWLVKYEFHS